MKPGMRSSGRSRKRRARWWHSIPTTAASSHWWAASTTSPNKYNRVTQARRLPGSGFKPFLYSAALDNGFTPATVLQDAPIVLDGSGSEEAWRPENSTREFGGPTRLREALVRSRNLVSIRILKELGIGTAIDYMARFGFDARSMPHDLTLALGTLDATPLDVAAGYAVFANGGYRVGPYFIDRIEEASGQVVWRAAPRMVCAQCDEGEAQSPGAEALRVSDPAHGEPAPLPAAEAAPRVISAQNAYLMSDMMSDVIKRGTGRRALVLGRGDIAGKTGTTNEAATPGSTASPAISWRPCGWASTRSVRSGRARRARAPRCRSGSSSCAKRCGASRSSTAPCPMAWSPCGSHPRPATLVSAENPDGVPEIFMANHLPDSGAMAQTPEQASSEPIF